ncbi:MAG: DNA-binding response regulator [Flavobacteriaceae bacterium]|nr:MAG: DNA-binding response regulator [Flavobacteriaceae bacterium]
MLEKKKLLLVEDDSSLGAVLKDYLNMNDFQVTHAIDGEDGFEKFKAEDFDLCILDVMMPKKDGFTLAEEIKAVNKDIPLIFLTAKAMKEDQLKGYKLGAEDYVTKPFDPEVLIYKINAILQRNTNTDERYSQEKFDIAGHSFNSRIRELKIGTEQYKLSPKESELLKLLCIFKNDLMPRELALNRIWNDDNYFTSRSMDVYIAKLRKYFADEPKVEIINIHGEGFRLLIQE